MKNKFKKKPTNKELANTIVEISNRMNYLYNIVRGFDGIFSIYLDMKGDKEKLEKELERLEKEKKENEQKRNGEPDKENLSGDTDGERSRAEGVRQESK